MSLSAPADDQWPPEIIAAAAALGLPATEHNRLRPLTSAGANAGAIDPADALAVTNLIAKTLCAHATSHPGCACANDPLACFAMSIFGDEAVAVLCGLNRAGLTLEKR
jgi:hypothetical protein